jgi:uncharacterized protein (DUF924 family)
LLLCNKIGLINGLRYEFEVRDNNEIDIGYQRKSHRPEGGKTTEMDAVISSDVDPAVSLPERAQALLDAWFGPPGDPGREQHREIWFKSPAEFDNALREAFLADLEAESAGELRSWKALPEGALALVLLLDQIPRNIFRGTPRAYATDAAARAVADRALAQGFDRLVPPVWRLFFYMPFHHSEDLADQRRSVALFDSLPRNPDRRGALRRYGRTYIEVIERFGRFPHRNKILGRESTPDEIAFLAELDKRAPHAETEGRSSS